MRQEIKRNKAKSQSFVYSLNWLLDFSECIFKEQVNSITLPAIKEIFNDSDPNAHVKKTWKAPVLMSVQQRGWEVGPVPFVQCSAYSWTTVY